MAELTKVYISHLALENGILEKFVEDPLTQDRFIKVYDNDSDISTHSLVDRCHVHSNEKLAIQAGEAMRTDVMLSLQERMRALYEHEIKVIRG